MEAGFIIPDNPPITALATLWIPIKRYKHRNSGLDPENKPLAASFEVRPSSRNKYRRALRHWIPAFAGMTALLFAGRINN